jgi:hypothetical protein
MQPVYAARQANTRDGASVAFIARAHNQALQPAAREEASS